MSDKPLILTGKRKRAAVSYAEPDDDVFEPQSDDEQTALLVSTDLSDSEDGGTFGVRSKVRFLHQLS